MSYASRRLTILERYCAANPTRAVRRLMRELTQLVDGCTQNLWHNCVTAQLPESLHDKICLTAIGGYGRAELLPCSDIDVLVLLASDLSADERVLINAAIERWVSASWDMGLTLSHSLRTIDEAVADSLEDLATQTAILEGRFLAGAANIHRTFYAGFHRHFNLNQFWRAKVAEMRARHARFDDTPYSLEPNCKESPGGLRDLHLMIWLSKAAQIGQNWADLHHAGWLSASQLRLITRCENSLLALRAHLHIISRRMENRILFDLQSQMAQAFGLTDTDGKRASEWLMQRYYLSARGIHQQFTLFLQKFESHLAPPSAQHLHNRIAGFPDFIEVDHILDLKNDNAFIQKPSLLIDVFYVYGKTSGLTGFSARLWDAILRSRNLITPQFRRNPLHQDKFIRFLKLDNGITHAIRLMNQTGVLGRYLPAFRRIIGQMQHDLFHIYTVDQHILTVVRNLRRFTLPEHMYQHELANQVMMEFNQPWLLYIAGLFHDIAKGRGGDHSDLGAVDVARFAKQHRLSTAQTDLVVFLVREHLTMSTFAQKEDLSDADVIARFARIVGDATRLKALYLLTVADIRGTSPKVWNAWKDKLLADLYHLTLHALSGQKRMPKASLIQVTQNNALKTLPETQHDALQTLWRDFAAQYFLRHDTATIAWHGAQIMAQPERSTVVAARPFDDAQSLLVMVYTADARDLFARLCSFFQRKQWSIFDAQIYTSLRGMALDTFQITLPPQQTATPEFIDALQTELASSLSSNQPLRAPNLGRLTARSRNFPIVPSMSLSPAATHEYVLKLAATDRSGVLYSIAYILQHMNIQLISARIVTLGERLEDVFVLSSEQLANPAVAAQLETELMRVCTI
ncbi:MAG: [protein-PII] uridylyltransferase [Formosimonas sp.]